MPKFLFQQPRLADMIYVSYPHRHTFRNNQISTKEIPNDFRINTTESVIVRTDSQNVLNRIPTAFARILALWETKRITYAVDGF